MPPEGTSSLTEDILLKHAQFIVEQVKLHDRLRDKTKNMYRKLHGSRSINEKLHACLRNIRNSASAKHERYYEYFAKHKYNFSLILREQVQFPFNIIFLTKRYT